MIDENYLIIGTHVDPALQQKIVNHEYVDFARLIPRGSRVSREEDNCLEIISRGGATYFIPAADREASIKSNFGRWEQAFRVVSNIFTRAYSHRSS